MLKPVRSPSEGGTVFFPPSIDSMQLVLARSVSTRKPEACANTVVKRGAGSPLVRAMTRFTPSVTVRAASHRSGSVLFNRQKRSSNASKSR